MEFPKVLHIRHDRFTPKISSRKKKNKKVEVY